MKKCSSCAKDLPDSALHCVFCGARQAPAQIPGAAAQQAKTVLGYQAADVMKEMAARAGRTSAPPPMGAPGFGGPPAPLAAGMAPTMASPPPAPAQAATMFVSGGAAAGAHNAPAAMPPPAAPMPVAYPPSGPAAIPPYLASQSAARALRPVEPYTDGLKLVMLAFGILLLGAFATPMTTNPMTFHWNVIVDAQGVAKLTSLMLVATGLLALVIALLPLAVVGRGMIATGLGVFIIATPIIQAGTLGAWQELVLVVASLLVVAGLMLRQEYRDAMLGRILTTVGAVAILLTYLLPVGGTVPLIGLFQMMIELPGAAKIAGLLLLVPAVLAIVSLLAWMPAPASAGAKALAWIWIVLPAVFGLISVALKGDLGGEIKAAPYGALMSWVSASAALGFVGYGVASVLGKRLE